MEETVRSATTKYRTADGKLITETEYVRLTKQSPQADLNTTKTEESPENSSAPEKAPEASANETLSSRKRR